jgi:hypothetical protein
MATTLSPAIAYCNPCATKNLMPDYVAFLSRTSGMPAAARAQAFVTTIALKHPEFYVPEDYGGAPEILASSIKFFGSQESAASTVAATEKQLRATTSALLHAVSTVGEQYKSAFPDFSCRAKITIGPSLGRFDAYGFTDSKGRDFMRYGVDKLARDHEPSEMPIVVADTFFQIYFSQLYPQVSAEDFDETWQAMWIAGVSAYVSQQLNRGIGDRQALALAPASFEAMERPGMLEKAARALLADFDKRDSTTFMQWFSASRSQDGFPKGTGAYVGLLMAKEVGRDHTVNQIAHIRPDDEKLLIRRFLEREAKAGQSGVRCQGDIT